MIMLTLSAQHGKEEEAEQLLHTFKETIFLNAEIICGEERKIHYHVLSKEDNFDLDQIMKKWPGIVQKHKITESQACHIRKYH